MQTIAGFLELVLGTIIALLPVINPPASAPTFLAITEGDTPAYRLQQLRMACVYMVGILVSFLVGGTFIMTFFGISIPGLRIAGGLMVAAIGTRLVLGPAPTRVDEAASAAARAKQDVSFSPLAMPMLSGPGSIAVTIGLASLAEDWVDYIAIVIGILAVSVITYVTLRLSERVVSVIGANGMNALSKMMGFLLLCIGVQFIVNGLIGAVADPEVMRMLRGAMARP